MENYFLDGGIPVSNNFIESCVARPYAVRRKNFYYNDTVNGAEASSIIYSLAQTAKLNNISFTSICKGYFFICWTTSMRPRALRN